MPWQAAATGRPHPGGKGPTPTPWWPGCDPVIVMIRLSSGSLYSLEISDDAISCQSGGEGHGPHDAKPDPTGLDIEAYVIRFASRWGVRTHR